MALYVFEVVVAEVRSISFRTVPVRVGARTPTPTVACR
jgi:hypothetical protein